MADPPALRHDLTHDLMSQNDRKPGRRGSPFDFVKFGMTDAADPYLEKNLILSGLGYLNAGHAQGLTRHGKIDNPVENERFHRRHVPEF